VSSFRHDIQANATSDGIPQRAVVVTRRGVRLNSSAIKISPATPSDITALCALLDVLFSQEAEFMPDHEAQSRGLALIIGDPEVGRILVARQGAEIVGMVSLLYTVSTALGTRVALLEDMVVAPGSRGGGVGSGLLQDAIGQARLDGCRRITLLTDRVNASAQRFYQSHGFAASPMVPLRLMLDEPVHDAAPTV
jgi:GNAT superfamily N-acetyltransferase